MPHFTLSTSILARRGAMINLLVVISILVSSFMNIVTPAQAAATASSPQIVDFANFALTTQPRQSTSVWMAAAMAARVRRAETLLSGVHVYASNPGNCNNPAPVTEVMLPYSSIDYGPFDIWYTGHEELYYVCIGEGNIYIHLKAEGLGDQNITSAEMKWLLDSQGYGVPAVG
jgi:hypothetical protein